jgi:phosphoenolpyruvate carboxylase
VHGFYVNSNTAVFLKNYYDLTEEEKFEVLSMSKDLNPDDFENEITKSNIQTKSYSRK